MWRASMENDHKLNNFVSLDIDRDAESSVESQTESTLSNSFESGLTIQSLRGDADSKLGEFGGWTNEKHNSYLDYLENSFVKQLYSLLGGEARIRSRTRDSQSNSRKSVDQFMVLRNGCWEKVNFDKKRDHSETSSEFHCQKNSLRWSDGSYNTGNAVKGTVLCNEGIENSGDKAFTRASVRNSYTAQSTAEASGQNFKEVEKGCTSEASRKRKRETKCDDSSLNDQVVP